MLARMLSALSPRRAPKAAKPEADHAAAAHAFLSREIASAPQVAARAAAANDDPLAEAYEPVERELRRAGYLR